MTAGLFRQHWASVLLLLLCFALLGQHYPYLISGAVPPDAESTYGPLARQFIEQGWSLFSQPASVSVAPGSYLYMVPVGGNLQAVKWLNLGLACLSVFLLYDLLKRLAGPAYGVGVALIYVLDPLMQSVTIKPLSEPPFLFFTLLWLWSTLRACQAERGGLWIVLAGLALAGSILTRGILFYWVFAAIFITLGVYLLGRSQLNKKQASRILQIHALALLPVLAYITHNHTTHQVSMIATGSATALYMGNNPATHGYEPPYFGLMHDVWMLNDSSSHLSAANEKRLAYGAGQLIRELGVSGFAELTANKLAANLFFSPAGLSSTELVLCRSVRIVLLILAGYGLWHHRRELLVIMLGGLLLYMTAILGPIMYNARYSMGSLELPLIALAGLGLGQLLKRRQTRQGHLMLGVMLAGVILGWVVKALQPMPTLDLSHTLLKVTPFVEAQPEQFEQQGFARLPVQGTAAVVAPKPVLHWDVPAFTPTGGTPLLVMDLQQVDPSCTRIRLEHQGRTLKLRNLRLRQGERFAYGTLPLGLDHPGGRLSIGFNCKVGSELNVSAISIQAIQTGLRYREQVLQQCAAQPNQLLCHVAPPPQPH